MLNLQVEPLDGAPPLTEPVSFIPTADLGAPTLTTSGGPANYAAAWLNNRVAGLSGETVVGELSITLPQNAPASAAYSIHFEHVSASPNGLGLFQNDTTDGLVTLKDRSASHWRDGISDAWRLRHFRSLSDPLSQSLADPDLDGTPNWAEFRAGTNPNSLRSRLILATRLGRSANGGAQQFVLRWPTVAGKQYVIERSESAGGGNWSPVSPILTGTGADAEYGDSDIDPRTLFYRVRLVE